MFKKKDHCAENHVNSFTYKKRSSGYDVPRTSGLGRMAVKHVKYITKWGGTSIGTRMRLSHR